MPLDGPLGIFRPRAMLTSESKVEDGPRGPAVLCCMGVKMGCFFTQKLHQTANFIQFWYHCNRHSNILMIYSDASKSEKHEPLKKVQKDQKGWTWLINHWLLGVSVFPSKFVKQALVFDFTPIWPWKNQQALVQQGPWKSSRRRCGFPCCLGSPSWERLGFSSIAAWRRWMFPVWRRSWESKRPNSSRYCTFVHKFWVKNRGTSMIYKVDQRNINDPPSRSWNVEVEGWVQSIFVWHVRHVDNWGVVSNQTGWWFGTFVIFPYIWKFIIPTDFHISQKGRSTTNQQSLGDCLIVWSHGPGGGSSKTQNPWTCCKEADFSITK